MARSTTRLLRAHIRDLIAVLFILAKETIIAVIIILLGKLLVLVSGTTSTGHRWSTDLVLVLADLFAIGALVILAIRDLWDYFREG